MGDQKRMMDAAAFAYFRHSPDDINQCELVVVADGELFILPIDRTSVLNHIQELLKFL